MISACAPHIGAVCPAAGQDWCRQPLVLGRNPPPTKKNKLKKLHNNSLNSVQDLIWNPVIACWSISTSIENLG